MKKTVAVLFGGQSSEHEVSCLSAVNIISNGKVVSSTTNGASLTEGCPGGGFNHPGG